VTDGRTPAQIDRVLGLWQRLLSGLGPEVRLYFYLLRRPGSTGDAPRETRKDIAAVSERNGRAFPFRRVQAWDAYIVCGDRRWALARRGAHARRTTRCARGVAPSLRTDQQAGHGVGRGDGERHELAARALGTRSRAQPPPPRRRAGDPVFATVAPQPGAREPAQGPVLPGRGADGLARMVAVDGREGAEADPGRAAPLLLAPLLDDGAHAPDRGHGFGDGRFGGCGGVEPAWKRAGRT